MTYLQSAGDISLVDINIYQLVLNQGFKCSCRLKDEFGNVFAVKDLVIEGDDYTNWSSDEEMTNLILSKLGLTPIPTTLVE